MAKDNENVVLNGFGPQLLLLGLQSGAEGTTFSEISVKAKDSVKRKLMLYSENLKVSPRLKNFKTRSVLFVTSASKYVLSHCSECFKSFLISYLNSIDYITLS